MMLWPKSRYREQSKDGRPGRLVICDNAVESEEGYIIACIPMGAGKFCFTLARKQQSLKVIRDIPDRRDAKQKAFTEMKAFAEQHLEEQLRSSSTAGP